jgi:hypothetical protein
MISVNYTNYNNIIKRKGVRHDGSPFLVFSCSACHRVSSLPHSRYTRATQDLPIAASLLLFCLFPQNGFLIHLHAPLKCLPSDMKSFPSGRRTLHAGHTLRKIAFSMVHLPASHYTLLTIKLLCYLWYGSPLLIRNAR